MIKIVKLMTGEEVIAEMSMDISSIKLVKPFIPICCICIESYS